MKGSPTQAAAKRKFKLLDGLLLIAGIAMAMAGVRRVFPTWPTLEELDQVGWQASISLLLSATFILIPIRLIPPRPRGKRLWRQPGWVASLSIALALLLWIFVRCSQMLLYSLGNKGKGIWFGSVYAETFISDIFIAFPEYAVFAIAAAWSILALTGVWRSEKGWIDWLGRLFGVCWLVHPCCVWGYEFVQAVWWPQSL